MQPYPTHAWNLRHGFYQLRQALLLVEVDAVVGKFLGDDLELAHPICHQFPDFIEDFFHGTAFVAACDDGNSAVSAFAVTALGYFQIGVVFGRGEHAAVAQRLVVIAAKVGEQFLPVELAVKLIHLRHFRNELIEVSFRKATHYEHFFEFAALFCVAKFEYHVHTLLFSVADKAASVHHGHVAVRPLGVVVYFIAEFLELPHQLLRIHKVFGAAHRDDVYAVHIYNIV